MYFKIVCKLLLTVFQVALLQYLNSQIQFKESSKKEEKEAIKNLLFSFLIFISIFSSISALAAYSVGFPESLSNILFITCLLVVLGLWIMQHKQLILKNIKHLSWLPFIEEEVKIVKESMSNVGNSVMQDKYPFMKHYGKPAPQNLTKLEKPTFSKKNSSYMVLQYK